MDFSPPLKNNFVDTLTGYEARAAFNVNSATVFRADIDIAPIIVDNMLSYVYGEMANSFHAYNYYRRPLDFVLWYLSLSLSFHGKSEDEPPAPVPI